ncbi:MAG: glycosyltransferase family 2 protein [Anaerolineales bacterium]|nr:glycosyltransferase family 2 protein [Anaerolineales bacterium]
METLSVVIPAYNEEDGIEEIARRVLAVEPDLKDVGVEKLELLVVDDGSSDATALIAEGIDGVTLIKHEVNRGYGAALKTGFSQASGNLVGFLDADGTYPPEYFPKLCTEAMNGADLVIGSRMQGADSQMPMTRRIGNFFFANLLSLIGRQRVTDSASGMRVFKRDVLEEIYPLPDGLNLTPVMSTRALHEGLQIVEVPIPYSERVGRSKLSVVHDGSLFLRSIIWTALSYNPVRILGVFGALGILVAGLVGAGILYARLQGITSIGPWGVAALFAALVSGVGGLSVFSLGILFNYLVSLFYDKPIRQGLFGQPIFEPSLDRHFWWMGSLVLLVGFVVAGVSLGLGLRGWEVERLWLYLLGSAMFIILGMQLLIFWILMRVLEELSQRKILTQNDMFGV